MEKMNPAPAQPPEIPGKRARPEPVLWSKLMSDRLPVASTRSTPDRISPDQQPGLLSGLSEWVGSPVGRAVAQALPDVLRMARRPEPNDSRSFVSHILPSSDGASGVTLSEVDVDLNVPFIRRLTIRSASSWSVAPSVILADQRKRRRARWKLRALAAGAISIAAVVLARRSGLTLPGRLNPIASAPFLSASSTPSNMEPDKADPGAAE